MVTVVWKLPGPNGPGTIPGTAVPMLMPPSSRLPRKKSTRSIPAEPDGARVSMATPWITSLPNSTREPGAGLANWKLMLEQSPVVLVVEEGAVCAKADDEPAASVAARPSGATNRNNRTADPDMKGFVPFPGL